MQEQEGKSILSYNLSILHQMQVNFFLIKQNLLRYYTSSVIFNPRSIRK